MLLAVDIGNTNINLGVFELTTLIKKGIIPANSGWDKKEYLKCLDKYFSTPDGSGKKDIDSVVIASVVPSITDKFKKAVAAKFRVEPLIVNSNLNLGMKINFDKPEEIGADRLANAAAISHLFPHQSVIAVDFGTAITFDIIDKDNGYIGGVIAPGIGMVIQALNEKTALLPEIKIEKPDDVFGKDTERSMQSGVYYGMVGLVKFILDALIRRFNSKFKVIATGGWVDLIAGEINRIEEINPDLTLYGLWKINELNETDCRKNHSS